MADKFTINATNYTTSDVNLSIDATTKVRSVYKFTYEVVAPVTVATDILQIKMKWENSVIGWNHETIKIRFTNSGKTKIKSVKGLPLYTTNITVPLEIYMHYSGHD